MEAPVCFLIVSRKVEKFLENQEIFIYNVLRTKAVATNEQELYRENESIEVKQNIKGSIMTLLDLTNNIFIYFLGTFREFLLV